MGGSVSGSGMSGNGGWQNKTWNLTQARLPALCEKNVFHFFRSSASGKPHLEKQGVLGNSPWEKDGTSYCKLYRASFTQPIEYKESHIFAVFVSVLKKLCTCMLGLKVWELFCTFLWALLKFLFYKLWLMYQSPFFLCLQRTEFDILGAWKFEHYMAWVRVDNYYSSQKTLFKKCWLHISGQKLLGCFIISPKIWSAMQSNAIIFNQWLS